MEEVKNWTQITLNHQPQDVEPQQTLSFRLLSTIEEKLTGVNKLADCES